MSSEAQPGPPSPAMVLELIDADVPAERRGTSVRLKKVNWQVVAGDYWFVGGLHRSGKTDLLAVAAGITPPLSGRVLLFGKDPFTAPPGETVPEQLRVGLVFDGGRLLHHLNVAENVALPVAYHGNLPLTVAMEQIKPLLDLLELQEWQYSLPGSMSRNWQQRAGLARALALQPELLLVDNPLTGLDPQDGRWWLALLRQLSAGHPLFERRPLTLVVTGDSVIPWKDQARQFAVLKDSRLHIPSRRGSEVLQDPLWKEFMPTDFAFS